MRDMMTREIEVLSLGDTLGRGVKLLRRTKLDGIPVIDCHGKLMGIFTKANLMDAFLAGARKDELVDRFINVNAVTVRDDMPYEEVQEIVKHSPVGTGIVVNNAGEIQGVFTKVDMIMALFKESEKLTGTLHAIFNAMHNGAIMVDSNQTILTINNAGETMLGLTADQVQGCRFHAVFPGVDLRPALVESNVMVGVKVKLNGIKAICNISPVMEKGRVSGAVLIFQALTDLNEVAFELETTKRLYETLLAILNIAFEAIIVVDEHATISMVNEAACQFFQKDDTELLGKNVKDVIENTSLDRVLKTGMAETNDIQVIGGRPYIVSKLPIIRHGRIIGAVGKIVFRRLEEVKEVAEKLAQKDEELSYYKERIGKVYKPITLDHIITINDEMRKLKQDAELAARGQSTILITGESGTGKGLLSYAIHNASPRRKGPFVKVNCAAVPDNLLESEFFGYASGAFTGAQKGGKQGKFAVADNGTLFLDEIGDMSLNLQSKLLQVLQDKAFEPVGSNQTIKVDVRIIAATNQDLWGKVKAGEFRQDLYYRLNVINLRLVPLRSRPEDIIPLARIFLEKYSKAFDVWIDDLSLEVQELLLAHNWPGNVRELENTIERAVNFATTPMLQVDSLPFYLLESRDRTTNMTASGWPALPKKGDNLSRERIAEVLSQVSGNKSAAARQLGISRTWLYEKMRTKNPDDLG